MASYNIQIDGTPVDIATRYLFFSNRNIEAFMHSPSDTSTNKYFFAHQLRNYFYIDSSSEAISNNYFMPNGYDINFFGNSDLGTYYTNFRARYPVLKTSVALPYVTVDTSGLGTATLTVPSSSNKIDDFGMRHLKYYAVNTVIPKGNLLSQVGIVQLQAPGGAGGEGATGKNFVQTGAGGGGGGGAGAFMMLLVRDLSKISVSTNTSNQIEFKYNDTLLYRIKPGESGKSANENTVTATTNNLVAGGSGGTVENVASSPDVQVIVSASGGKGGNGGRQWSSVTTNNDNNDHINGADGGLMTVDSPITLCTSTSTENTADKALQITRAAVTCATGRESTWSNAVKSIAGGGGGGKAFYASFGHGGYGASYCTGNGAAYFASETGDQNGLILISYCQV